MRRLEPTMYVKGLAIWALIIFVCGPLKLLDFNAPPKKGWEQ